MASSALSLSRFLLMLRSAKRWWIPVLVLIIILINVGGLFLPRKYEAQAVVAIHQPKLDYLSTLSNEMTVDDRLKIISQEITSPDFLREVATKVNLDAGIAPDTVPYQQLLKKMAAAIDLRVKEQSYFAITYTADTPQLAQNVTRAIVDKFIATSDDLSASRAKKLEAMILSQLNDASAKLKAAQEAVMQYQREHFNEIPQAQESHLKSLNELTTQKGIDYNLMLNMQEKIDLARKRLEKMDPNIPTAAVGPQGGTNLQRMIDDKTALEMKLNVMLKDFMPKHPQVLDAKAQIAELEKQIAAAQNKGTKSESAIPNKDYVELQNQLALMELEVRRLQANVDQETKAIQTLNQYLSNIPKYKLPLDQLENERRTKQEQVEQLTKKLNDAQIAVMIDRTGIGPSFELQTYPSLPLIPSSPNRKKIGILSAAMGLACSLGLVYLMTLFDNVVRSVEEARGVLQMPILGVVQRIITPQEEMILKRRRRRRILGVGTALTLAFAVVLVGLLFFRGPIEQSLETVRTLVNQW